MPSCEQIIEAIQILVLSAERLRGLSFLPDATDALLSLASLVTLRRSLGEARPAFVGLIGCTGTGKSTLFNSLAGSDLSAIGWRAHNTRGPVLLVESSFLRMLEDVERRFGVLLLPSLQRKVFPASDPPFTSGSPESMVLVTANSEQEESPSNSLTHSIVLIDLPDINTTLADEERLVALAVQPWLDTVVFVVDDETVYHRDYERPVAVAGQLGQTSLCVLSNRGRDRVDLNHPDLQNAKAFFGVDRIHVLPEICGETGFANEPAFVELRERILTYVQHAPEEPLLRDAAALARRAVDENRNNRSALNSIETSISALINDRLSHEPHISLERILDDEVLVVLRHLGLKRFAISNLYHFLKRVTTAGSLKRSFRLAFGDRRDGLLSRVLHLDTEKLVHEVTQRLSDHAEAVASTIRRTESAKRIMRIAPELRTSQFFGGSEGVEQDSLREALQSIVVDFEQRCQEIIASDTITASVRNDPLTALALVVVMVADVWLPGFGSWLLVPSVFKYVPLGKFESVKKQFQRAVHDVVRRNVLRVVGQVRDVRSRVALEDSDPLLTALEKCAEYEANED